MKSLFLFCFVFVFAAVVSAQTEIAITPTNRIELFNGTNFDGLTFCMRDDADPMKTWSVTNGVIHCNGSAIGYLRTKQSYSNYVVTVEWRFIKVTPKANNTGVLVHMQLPDKVWPPCIQNQGKSGRQGDLFVMSGVECKEHLALGKDANTPVALRGEANENAIGEWNTNVTVCFGNNVEAIINRKSLNEITECTVSSGFVGIQSEGADFEIRKMYLEPVDKLSLLPLGATDLIREY
jgi:3-keto-disaccharide hydrolase